MPPTPAPLPMVPSLAPSGVPHPVMTVTPGPHPTPDLRSLIPGPLPSFQAPGGGGCGFFDLACHAGHAIDSWFASLVSGAVNPLFGFLGRTLLSTPDVTGFATIRDLWDGSAAIADATYVLVVVAGGILLMTGGLLGAYTVKDIAPRLVIGFAAANLSLLLASKAISAANGLSAALAGQGLDPSAAGKIMLTLTLRLISTGGTFSILLGVFILVLALMLAGIFTVRLMLTVLLVAVAPLALACHGLRQTDGIARWWWRAFTGILLIQSAQAIVLVAALRVFFTEQWFTLIDVPTAGVFDTLQLIALLYVLARIPFWIGRRVWRTSGPSPIRSAVRYAVSALVLRRAVPALMGKTETPTMRERTTRTVTTAPSGTTTVRVRTEQAQRARQRKDGVTHSTGFFSRTSTVQRFPAPRKDGTPRKPSPPRTTTVTTTTHSAETSRSPYPGSQPGTAQAAQQPPAQRPAAATPAAGSVQQPRPASQPQPQPGSTTPPRQTPPRTTAPPKPAPPPKPTVPPKPAAPKPGAPRRRPGPQNPKGGGGT